MWKDKNLDKAFVEEIKKQFWELGYDNLWCEVVLATDGVFKAPVHVHDWNRIGVEFVPPPFVFSNRLDSKPEYTTVDRYHGFGGKENRS